MPDLIAIDLTEDERLLLGYGVTEWWGPARCTDALAVAMGFESKAHLHEDIKRLSDNVKQAVPMSATDWRRLLFATEVVFASDVVGAGLDWPITTGFSDADSIARLRSIQRKMPRWRGSFQFQVEHGEVVIEDAGRPHEDGE